MKKRILFISLAVVLALSIGLIGCGGDDDEEPEVPPLPAKIVIGVSSPLDGPLAPIRSGALTPVIDSYLARLNDAGGMLLKEYGADFRVPVEKLEYNDSSSLDTMLENTEKLITEDEVDFMFSACSTAFINAQAPLVNSLDYVLLTFEGGATTMKETLPGMPYVFVNLNFSDWYQLPVLAKILAEQGATTAYIVWINDLHGIEYNSIANEQFGLEGITVLKSVSISWLPPEAVAAAPSIVADAKSMDPDAFCMFGYVDQVLALTQEAKAQGFNPDALISGPGFNFGFMPFAAFGPEEAFTAVQGIMCFGTANNNSVIAGATMPMATLYNDILLPTVGYANMDWWGTPFYWAAMEMWQAAVEDIGYVNQNKFRDALANSEADPFDTVFGPTWYTQFGSGGGIMAYECSPGQVGQWQGDQVQVIGYEDITDDLPRYVVTADTVYPKPAW